MIKNSCKNNKIKLIKLVPIALFTSQPIEKNTTVRSQYPPVF